ncbi:type IV toxin-antitoxin system AbiEi family antitoxin domain-containing protein [Frankia sp. CNm7]|uniref:Type IV toxin-antitoxin system AbiEi family antitoxin domain-containing protein n=1 Tax=Frankia nepalensis TaxID=1836974 RepID=A0A937UQM2_9ACTN|nr:type IV toxin-antitoxin system AbiEi family antitoxin domain-containing protein [Frankia nepalensis]MBL7499625.1 type IV toxin-antitoxin system AbiEi family antitoxin domain-containing protein [Frankia nepalensis]MBL7514548.1 type IV toxin-antitoxin system AbiEi family antitoxin domain-containing protein [Frankia nepalensis]MBL7518006.1 type IV toxin-antitoxin system AbiEi family antitoxin domain-containing protein [Frankia nepalensis]MBL7626851.1 type IV toxin-antitoxin system AbiEi family 
MTFDRAQRGPASQSQEHPTPVNPAGGPVVPGAHLPTRAPSLVPAPRAGEPARAGEDLSSRLAARRAGVVTTREAVAAGFTRAEIRRLVEAGRWQLYSGEVLVTQPGPLTLIQRLWCALVSIGSDALLGGASAAALDGFRGYDEPWLTVILATGRRVAPRPGVRVRATARLGDEDLCLDSWPPRTTLPRSLVDIAEWAPCHDEAKTVLALAVASGIVESDELRAALARRGPITRRQVISDALDDLDAEAPWVPELLYRRVEARHGLPPGRRHGPDPRSPGRFDVSYERWQLRLELGTSPMGGIRTATEVVAAPTRMAAGVPLLGGPGPARASRLVLRAPMLLLRQEPDRIGAAVATTLRQRGWPGASASRPPAEAFGPALTQALGTAVGWAAGPGSDEFRPGPVEDPAGPESDPTARG